MGQQLAGGHGHAFGLHLGLQARGIYGGQRLNAQARGVGRYQPQAPHAVGLVCQQQQLLRQRGAAHLRPQPVQLPAAIGLGLGACWNGCAGGLGQRQGKALRATGQLLQGSVCAGVARQAAQGTGGQRDAVEIRHTGQAAAQLLLQQGQLHHAQAQAALLFGGVNATPAQLGQALPQGGVPAAGGFSHLAHLGAGAVGGEEFSSAVHNQALLFGQVQIHAAVLRWLRCRKPFAVLGLRRSSDRPQRPARRAPSVRPCR